MYRNAPAISLEELIDAESLTFNCPSNRFHRVYAESAKWRQRDAKQWHKQKLKVEKSEKDGV